jgi:hypothetical protein
LTKVVILVELSLTYVFLYNLVQWTINILLNISYFLELTQFNTASFIAFRHVATTAKISVMIYGIVFKLLNLCKLLYFPVVIVFCPFLVRTWIIVCKKRFVKIGDLNLIHKSLWPILSLLWLLFIHSLSLFFGLLTGL